MKDIDEMDMLGYLRLRAWAARREQKSRTPRRAYIDEVWPTKYRMHLGGNERHLTLE